jgi:hypothetical protein
MAYIKIYIKVMFWNLTLMFLDSEQNIRKVCKKL